MKDIEELQKIIKYKYKNIDLLQHALKHSSYVNEIGLPKKEDNERLEFLGDAILEAASSEFLYNNNPEVAEGELTKTRAALVCEPALAYCARNIGLGDYIHLGKGEEATGGRNRDSVLSDAFEALIGSIFLDGGFDSAKKFVIEFVMIDLDKRSYNLDAKTDLQEYVQGEYKDNVTYELLDESGPDHDKRFHVAVIFKGKRISEAVGTSKKGAEQKAAMTALTGLREGKICI